MKFTSGIPVDKMNLVESYQFIHELFDNPHTLTRLPIDTSDDDKAFGYTNHEVYALDNGEAGMMRVFDHNGAKEIHHIDKDQYSGEFRPKGLGANPRFVATVMSKVKELMDQGHSVRIVGPQKDSMIDKYFRLARKLTKDKNHVVSAVGPYFHRHPGSRDFLAFSIQPKRHPILGEWIYAKDWEKYLVENGY